MELHSLVNMKMSLTGDSIQTVGKMEGPSRTRHPQVWISSCGDERARQRGENEDGIGDSPIHVRLPYAVYQTGGYMDYWKLFSSVGKS